MKKVFSVLMTICTLLLATSCGDTTKENNDSTDTTVKQEKNESPKSDKPTILGKWYQGGIIYDGKKTTDLQNTTFTFLEDGTLKSGYEGNKKGVTTNNGKYRVDGNKFYMIGPDGEGEMTITKLTDKEMEWSASSGGHTVVMFFSRTKY